jgi:hypothetical protein
MERASSILKSWRLLLMVSGVALLLAGFYFHNPPLQVSGFLIAIFGAFGGACCALSGINAPDRTKDDHHG